MHQCQSCKTIFINEEITNCPACNTNQGDYTDIFRSPDQGLKDIAYADMSGKYQYCNHCDMYLKSEDSTCPMCNHTMLMRNVGSSPIMNQDGMPQEGATTVNEFVGISFALGAIVGSIITFMMSDASRETKAKRVLFGGKLKNSVIASNILKNIKELSTMEGIPSFTIKRISKALSELDDAIKNIKNVSPRTPTFITSGRMALVDLANVLLDTDYPLGEIMRLNLLNIDEFIQKNNVQEVTSLNTPSKTKRYSEPTLWSSDIFGNPGSRARSERFGYISLNTKIINPAVYRIVKGLNSAISAIMDGRKSYRFDSTTKTFIEDEEGRTGIDFLIENFMDIDFISMAKKEKKQEAKFVSDNIMHVLIDKFMVIPAQSRDLDIDASSAVVSDLNNIYLDVLRNAQSMLVLEGSNDEVKSAAIKQLQRNVYGVYNWLSKRLTGKKGVFRSNLLKKSTDFSSRLILASSPNIKFGEIGIPWHTLISLYAPIFYYTMRNKFTVFESDILEYMKITDFDRVGYTQFLKFATSVNKSPSTVPDIMVLKIKEILNEFISEQTILYKRDPALSRKSWASATPTIIDGAIAQLNSLDLGPLGGDCVTGDVSVFTFKNGVTIENVLDISEFPDQYKCEFVQTNTRSDGVEVSEYNVIDEVYARGIDIATGRLTCSQIHKWWIHKNLSMYNVHVKRSISSVDSFGNIECSDSNSLIGFDPQTETIQTFSPTDITETSTLMMLRDHRISPCNNMIQSKFEEHNLDITGASYADLGWFIGAWIGDGSILGYDRPSAAVAFSNCDPSLHNKLCRTLQGITSKTIRENIKVSKDTDVGFFNDSSRKAKRSSVSDKNISAFLTSNFGKRSGGKTLPNWLFQAPNEFVIGIISGLLDTDASISNNYMTQTTKSEKLAHAIQLILYKKFGINSTIHDETSNLTDYTYSRVSCRISQVHSSFWTQVAQNVDNELKSNKIVDSLSRPVKNSNKLKYVNINAAASEVKADSKRKIKREFCSAADISLNPEVLTTVAKNITIQNQRGDLDIVPVSKLEVTKSDTTTAYDFTVDPSQRSFITKNGMIVKNSDGDQILIAPVFSDEAKKAAEKMNPVKSKSKWIDEADSNSVVYGLSLDTVSAIYNVTKE